MATVTNARQVIGDLEKWAEATGQDLGQAVASAALQVFSATMTRTPVDTGRLRGNWQAAIDREPKGTVDRNASAAMSEARAVTQGFKEGSIFLVNNLPYAAVVEFGLYGDGPKTFGGFSKQAPRGMLRVSAAEFDSALRKAVRAANQSRQ